MNDKRDVNPDKSQNQDKPESASIEKITLLEQTLNWFQEKKWFVGIAVVVLTVSFVAGFIEDLGKIQSFFLGDVSKKTVQTTNLETGETSADELILVLERRAKKIVARLEEVRTEIDKRFYDYRQSSCNGDHDTEVCHKLAKESFEKGQQFAKLGERFLKLHIDHVAALKAGKFVVAHEIESDIDTVLTTEYDAIAVENIGLEPGTYKRGFKNVVVDVRAISGFQTRELFTYKKE